VDSSTDAHYNDGMKRALSALAGLAAILGCAAPAGAHGIPLPTAIVGSFGSAEDFFGLTFVLQNDSALAGLPGAFSNVLLQLNGGEATLFDGAELAPSGSLADTLDTFTTPFSSGLLTFVFTPEGLPSQDYELAFTSLVDPPAFFAYSASEGGGEPIPEPSTLVLLGLGAAGLASRRRRQSPPRSC